MEDIRQAIRQGRTLATQGLYEQAKILWKSTLSTSYYMQDYAGMFVLSVNVGEVCVRIAKQSNTISQALLQLQEANENLEYALQLVEKFSLCNILAGHGALYQGVMRAKTLKRKAKTLLDKLQQIEVEDETKRNDEVVEVCMTCEVGSEQIVLDENDGCYYCRKCYEEYYATFENDASVQTVEAFVAVYDVDGLEKEKKNERDEELGLENEKGDDSTDQVVAESSATTEPNHVTRIHSEGKDAEAVDPQKVEVNRTKYERVELGSLADYLAGTLQIERDKVQQSKIQQNDVCNDALELTAAARDRQEECREECITTDSDLQDVPPYETSLVTSDEDVQHEVGKKLLNEENIADRAHEKYEYSVARLLALRKLSPCECPESLLTSPVRDNGSTLTPVQTKANSMRKKSNSKKTTRLTTLRQENNRDTTGSNQLKMPTTTTDASPSISLLPSMDLCNTLREALQKETDNGAFR